MLSGFPPIFVVDTKIIYGYNFVSPLIRSNKSFILQGYGKTLLHQKRSEEAVCRCFAK